MSAGRGVHGLPWTAVGAPASCPGGCCPPMVGSTRVSWVGGPTWPRSAGLAAAPWTGPPAPWDGTCPRPGRDQPPHRSGPGLPLRPGLAGYPPRPGPTGPPRPEAVTTGRHIQPAGRHCRCDLPACLSPFAPGNRLRSRAGRGWHRACAPACPGPLSKHHLPGRKLNAPECSWSLVRTTWPARQSFSRHDADQQGADLRARRQCSRRAAATRTRSSSLQPVLRHGAHRKTAPHALVEQHGQRAERGAG